MAWHQHEHVAWFQGSVWEKIRGGLEYVPGVIKAIKSAKIEASFP